MTTARRKKRTRVCRTFSFRVYLDEDGDLIAWLEALSSRQRSETVRDILRSHRSDGSLAQALAAQGRDVQQILEILKSGVVVGQPPVAQIDDAATERRKQNLLEAAW